MARQIEKIVGYHIGYESFKTRYITLLDRISKLGYCTSYTVSTFNPSWRHNTTIRMELKTWDGILMHTVMWSCPYIHNYPYNGADFPENISPTRSFRKEALRTLEHFIDEAKRWLETYSK
jgi:hypothetical protein